MGVTVRAPRVSARRGAIRAAFFATAGAWPSPFRRVARSRSRPAISASSLAARLRVALGPARFAQTRDGGAVRFGNALGRLLRVERQQRLDDPRPDPRDLRGIGAEDGRRVGLGSAARRAAQLHECVQLGVGHDAVGGRPEPRPRARPQGAHGVEVPLLELAAGGRRHQRQGQQEAERRAAHPLPVYPSKPFPATVSVAPGFVYTYRVRRRGNARTKSGNTRSRRRSVWAASAPSTRAGTRSSSGPSRSRPARSTTRRSSTASSARPSSPATSTTATSRRSTTSASRTGFPTSSRSS